jgi:CheY-like chemotaxis protein
VTWPPLPAEGKEAAVPPLPDLALAQGAPAPSLPAVEPGTDAAVPGSLPGHPPGVAVAHGPPQALVADRDATLRSVLAAALRDEGYQVMEVEDGPAVRRALTGRRLQVVVLNVFLPEILGVTLCSEIKRHPQLNEITVLLVGSLYRRDRFMRDPDDLYGADGFIDGSAPAEEVRKTLVGFCRARSGAAPPARPDAVSEHEELARLARIVVGDIILYNPESAQQELAAGNFLHAFAAEMKEGQSLVEERFAHIPGHVDLYFKVVKDTIARHCEAAGMNTGLRA